MKALKLLTSWDTFRAHVESLASVYSSSAYGLVWLLLVHRIRLLPRQRIWCISFLNLAKNCLPWQKYGRLTDIQSNLKVEVAEQQHSRDPVATVKCINVNKWTQASLKTWLQTNNWSVYLAWKLLQRCTKESITWISLKDIFSSATILFLIKPPALNTWVRLNNRILQMLCLCLSVSDTRIYMRKSQACQANNISK